jgi:hypothetical protein
MKLIKLYECEICNCRYEDRGSAVRCEDRGPAAKYPIGCIYGNHRKGNMYENITFAVAVNRLEDHANYGASWACRDTGHGDSLGEAKCGGPSLHLTKYTGQINPTNQHFQRMVYWLRKQQIEITVWDGREAILYGTFVNNCVKKVYERNDDGTIILVGDNYD